MKNAVILFTFSPVQSFIAEARRAEDLFNGSAILSQLARAAGEVFKFQGDLIYPAQLEENDAPNVLVARVPADKAETTASWAREALLKRWQEIAEQARKRAQLDEDDTWRQIWQRQIVDTPPWQIYWAYAEEAESYAEAYRRARNLLESVKHSRLFSQSHEEGEKDSLSGQRSALHTAAHSSAREYWKRMASKPHILPSQVHPEGREILDGIGLVKRFWEGAKWEFPSTSTVAAWDFYQAACAQAPQELQRYRECLETVSSRLYQARKQDKIFPYDGDLFFAETLTARRLKDSYNVVLPQAELENVRKHLKALIDKVGKAPSPYYMLIQFDGDGIGKKIDYLLARGNAKNAHRRFSQNIGAFSNAVRGTINPNQGGFLIYNGGDDVLLLASLERGLQLAIELVKTYQQMVRDGFNGFTATASAGIVIAHHLTPLSKALTLLRSAERRAKESRADSLGNKGVVCLTLAKRGGEALSARSAWEDVANFDQWVEAFRQKDLAGVFPYALAREAATLEALPSEATRSLVRYLIQRHTGERVAKATCEQWADALITWADNIRKRTNDKSGLTEVAHWLIAARFIASGGAE